MTFATSSLFQKQVDSRVELLVAKRRELDREYHKLNDKICRINTMATALMLKADRIDIERGRVTKEVDELLLLHRS